MTSLPTPIIGLIVAVFVLVWLVLRHPCSCADRDAGGGLHRRSVGGNGH
ncbi:permease [Salmonella enterica subsp. enterica]|nr:permease [Salmonella enterica subsp. enterica] [Salmonella enterica subsp. enterica serovar Menston]